MDNLSGLIAFVRAAENQSFTLAGRALGISSSAVGKSVSRLEERIGVRLFHRSTRQISLTSEGLDFFGRCRTLLQQLQDAEAALSHSKTRPRGRLRISLPAVGYRLISGMLREFYQRYPEIELDLDFSDRLVDVVDEAFDAVIRSGELPDSSLAAKRICTFRFVLCAAPDYLQRYSTAKNVEDLQHYKGIAYKFPSNGKLQPWWLKVNGDTIKISLETTVVMNSVEAVLAACRNGLGLAYLPDFVIQEYLASHELIRVLPELSLEGDFWIVWSPSRLLSPKTRAFIDFLGETQLISSPEGG
ncbi:MULTISPECIES: LysR family transcriptional regulator [Pseudomonas]|uniref:LysR family transcriptional regulator n=3 Tax=Pseudomonas TaxID=286 RepID=A0A0G3GLG2_9PSED|nr:MULTISPECIES: LysR family transcriptional regulator [Pseudomonas]AKK00353.1 LysR family transcriptional regulator [Pseudomonas chlororaphis]KIQ61083.1 LysR family transcriptional regulator [Pseudomonas fluorescens]ROM87190.1 LysR family transcriptional regulator [Pseudomonas brassicacearum]BBP63175.1 LysR family transcriptional regulator [Pseudomonas sp. Cab53]